MPIKNGRRLGGAFYARSPLFELETRERDDMDGTPGRDELPAYNAAILGGVGKRAERDVGGAANRATPRDGAAVAGSRRWTRAPVERASNRIHRGSAWRRDRNSRPGTSSCRATW